MRKTIYILCLLEQVGVGHQPALNQLVSAPKLYGLTDGSFNNYMGNMLPAILKALQQTYQQPWLCRQGYVPDGLPLPGQHMQQGVRNFISKKTDLFGQ